MALFSVTSLLLLLLKARGDPLCNKNAYLDYGNDLYWQNNEWGSEKALNDSWQCVEIINNNQAKLTYNWITNHSNNHSVKAYPHIGVWSNTTNKLPIKISDNIPCISSWSTTHKTLNNSKEDRWDNMYDIWIRNTSDRNGERMIEIMIWLAYTHPIDGQLMDTNIKFKTWRNQINNEQLIFDSYYAVYDDHTFPTYSFVSVSNNNYTWNVSNVDLNEMFQYLYNKGYVAGDQYISDINAGVEISDGNGQFLYEYSLKIDK